MIEDEIREIVADSGDDGLRLNEIADEFRNGRDVRQILSLLDSEDADLVSSGAWILGELQFDLYASQEFVSRLRELVRHSEALVRFHAFGALFPALDAGDAASGRLVRELLDDPNEGVRIRAESASRRLGIVPD